jgi:DNA-binding transcriptional ArsR family regulator
MVHYPPPDLTRVFHALGDPTRMAMYQRISQSEAAASELAGPLNITLTATLKHLRVLEKAGLATTVKVGRERRCRVQAQALSDIERWVEETRKAWTFQLDNLDRFLQLPENNK